MNLNPTFEKFYKSIVSYAGMELSENIFINKNSKLGNITINGKSITLPYFENLKSPDGKIIFHLLNENFTSPENSIFLLYKKRLVLELNLKLSSLIISIISVASDVQLQQRIKSSKLIELISSIGEVDHSLIETFLALVKAGKKVHEEAFLFDIYLRKNGEIDGVPYSAIGKINFHMYNEISKAIEDKEREYKVYNHKLRKKDLLALNNIFNAIFPDIDQKEKYTEGTDNKIFRYLNILLKTSYIPASLINEKAKLLEELDEPSLNLEYIYSDLEWAEYLEELYDMQREIRMIPNQVDISVETPHLNVDESKASKIEQQKPNQSVPVYDPNIAQRNVPSQPQANQQQPQYANQTPRQLTPEEIIRGSLNAPVQQNPQMFQPPMYMNQPYMQPNPPQQEYIPLWIQQEMVRRGQNPNTYQQPGYPQQQIPPQYAMMQPGMNPQMMNPGFQPPMQQMPQPMGQYPQYPQYPNQQFQPQYPQYPNQQFHPQYQNEQPSLQVNPHFLSGRNSAPWS